VRVVETPPFKKAVKRLHRNQKKDLDEGVKSVVGNPMIGEQKAGDLAWLRVYKFRMVNQVTLLAYEYATGSETVILHGVGSHENFYRDLKAK
jgi:mRNA-degrading endonuclease RelE of RelBE toxin-antitoxin system